VAGPICDVLEIEGLVEVAEARIGGLLLVGLAE
jgi:hypothetical protein